MTSHPEQGQDFSKNSSCAGLFYSAAIEKKIKILKLDMKINMTDRVCMEPKV